MIIGKLLFEVLVTLFAPHVRSAALLGKVLPEPGGKL
jgi:hypothetical protein